MATPWGKILEGAGYGMKATGSIFGNIFSSRAARKTNRLVNQQLDNQESRATSEFESQYYADPSQLAGNQLALTKMQDYLRDQRKARAAANAVTGGTEESVAAAKAVDNQAVGNLAANMASSTEARRNALRDQYNNVLTGISNARIAQIQNEGNQKQQNIGNWMNTVNQFGNSMIASGQGLSQMQGKA